MESILNLWENTSFHNYIINDEGRNKYQVTFIFKENQGKSLINTEQMVIDEHIFVINRNRLHHCGVHTQIMGKHNSSTTKNKKSFSIQ